MPSIKKRNNPVTVYLGLGSNIGDKKSYLLKAIRELDSSDDIRVSNISSFYLTSAYGYEEQENFINTVVQIKTTLTPLQLLNTCQSIEQRNLRTRVFRWGPRTLDIDILLYGHEVIKLKRLTIPHKELLLRDFVVYPLIEIAPRISLPCGNLVKDNAKISTHHILEIVD